MWRWLTRRVRAACRIEAMPRGSTVCRAAIPLLGGWMAVSCRAPTEITIVLSTDVPCADLRGTSITVGRLGEIEAKAATTSSTFCDASGDLGALVVVPSGGNGDEVAIKLVAGLGKDADGCA